MLWLAIGSKLWIEPRGSAAGQAAARLLAAAAASGEDATQAADLQVPLFEEQQHLVGKFDTPV